MGLLEPLSPQAWVVPTGWTAHPQEPPARCRSCKAEVLWATTPAGKRTPLNRDGFYRTRKVLELAEGIGNYPLRLAAIGLHLLTVSWSNAQLADGVVTLATVRMLGGSQEIADELVRVGMWEATSPGVWTVHDYG